MFYLKLTSPPPKKKVKIIIKLTSSEMASQCWTYLTLKSSFQQQRFRIQDSQRGSLRRKIVLGSKFTFDFYPFTQISMLPSPFLAHYLPSCQDPHLFYWAQLWVTHPSGSCLIQPWLLWFGPRNWELKWGQRKLCVFLVCFCF